MSIFWTAPAWTWPLLLALAVGAVSLSVRFYRQTWPQPRPGLKRWLIGLRSAVLALLVLAIAGPVLTRLAQDRKPADLLILVEDSGSMELPAAAAVDDSTVSRWHQAWTLAARVDSALTAEFPHSRALMFRGNGLGPLQEVAADQAMGAAPDGYGTDLRSFLRQSFEAAVDRSVRGILLLSDGQETESSSARSSRTGGLGAPAATPLVAVGLGDPRGPADRIIKDLRYPGTVYRGADMLVELTVDDRFVERGTRPPIEVRLFGPEGVVARQTVPADAATVPVELVFRPDSSGPQVYRVEVSPLDNERFLENNEALLAVDVRPERAEVVLLTDRPGWDVRFLAQGAAREPRLDLTRVFSGPEGPVFADSLVQWSPPASVEEWLRWDGLILSGWGGPVAALDWKLLGDAVAAGLGLLVIPGDGSTLPSQPLAPPPAGLADLLPVRIPETRWLVAAAEPWAIIVTPSGRSHLILAGLANPAEGLPVRSWAELPPLRALVPAVLVADGRSLIEVRGRSLPGQPVRIDPLLAVTGRGQGRVGWYGGRNLWEQAFWNPAEVAGRSGTEPQIARQLVRNLLIWTAEGSTEKELSFAGRRLAYQEGETIRISSNWRDLRGQPVTGRRLELLLRSTSDPEESGEAEVRTFDLEEIEGRPGEAEVVLPALPPGAYSVQLNGEGQPPVVSQRESLVVTRNSIEATQVRQDQRRLRSLASGSQDRYVDGNADRVLERVMEHLRALDWDQGSQERRSRFDPLAGWPLLLVACLLLGVEWFLRRRNGLL